MTDSFDLGEPPQPARAETYRVLARKYRPQTFAELIGQDAMVTTLGNAIKRDRLAHAFLLTGVRGVGKTSTARLIAKALNCIGPDGNGGPTIDPCGVCSFCTSIAEGRCIDVLEQDAASNTKVEQMRELLDNVPYAAASARYKIYIIDEVHMLSNSSFNALLKTLEEPPAHVKFLFATTEVNKVPVTVLSRCQRFDLRRIPADLLADHFAKVVTAENVTAEPEALALIARAAEGSARDGLSILDQAIAHADSGGGGVTAPAVREMLGLSDRSAVRDLMALLLSGDAPGALSALRRQYDYGVDPLGVLRALLEAVHGVTLLKVGAAADAAQSAEERDAFAGWAEQLSFPALHRLWQLLLKGHDEVARAALPIEAAEMALLRVIHASSLPDPGELARRIASGEGAPVAPVAPAAPVASPSPPVDRTPSEFAGVMALLEAKGHHALYHRLLSAARVVRFETPEIDFSGTRPIAADTLAELAQVLKAETGRVWKIAMVDAPGAPTMKEREDAAAAAERQAVLDSPLVRAAFESFPEAELEDWPKTLKHGA
ncbi:DNA polymerase III subunit gamma/tau [Sphingomonas sp. EC-HK361]|uniref:DNA polymerase III subunit gamma/tau n=1 Tax=Sphingomonas sp. EC-HK361 TaxID=2038397 RepID=UPI00125C480D|nr:DNA polymerase III subunit gamma/tau [Sphingomonas sp. EC-HK361]VVT24738.1 DNA polymerase III subunit gamma/tau [Sphingomonas sp. EC-HK361]